MARWAGKLGFVKQTETSPGIWAETVTERLYKGEVIKSRNTFSTSSTINAQINVSNQISLVADPYALNNFAYIRYITYLNQKWNVTDLSYEKPRLTISIGGLYGTQSN